MKSTMRCAVFLTALLLSACGGGDDDDTPDPIIPAISSFTAASTTVTAGTGTTLTGVFTNGTGLVGNGVGALTSGTAIATGNLSANTTFILTVTSSTGNAVSSSATVNVVAAPVITAFQAQNPTASATVGTRLTFTFSGGTGTVNQGVGNVTSGTPVDITPAATTTYTLTVTNAAATAVTATTTVTVVPLPVITSLVASPATVRPGGAVALTANFSGGVGTISGPAGVLGTMLSGTAFNTTVAASSTFTLEVTNAAGDTAIRTTDVAVSRFSATGTPQFGRQDHFLTVLQDGKVLVVGGQTLGLGGSPSTPVLGAEIYDPATEMFTATGVLPAGFTVVSSTRLADGRVLVVSANAAQLFDPATGAFTATGGPLTTRSGHRAALLQDGRVLLVGGAGSEINTVRTAELYDPGTGLFTYTTGNTVRNASMYLHTIIRLNSGNVLICGGYNGIGATTTAACELYLPATQTFRATGSLVVPRIGPVSTLLPDGRVLIAGGPRSGTNTALWGPEIYDPVTETSTGSGTLPYINVCRANTLADGTVLLLGLRDGNTAHMLSNTLFNPANSALTDVGPMVTLRDSCDFATAVLQSGHVLISGGHENTAPVDTATAEIFYY